MAGHIGTVGTDATGADAYAVVAAARDGGFKHIRALCATQDALLSVDGTNDDFVVPAGSTWVEFDLDYPCYGSVYAKNRTAGQNYTAMWVNIW